MLAQNVIYHGIDTSPPERTPLRAGRLSLTYEGGELRYIKFGNREIVRRLYVGVRDGHWGTIPSLLTNVQTDIKDDSFRITFDARANQGDLDFAWKGAILGHEDGSISFTMDGEACSTFWRNRIGFCVLHPMHECAGAPCRIEHVDGIVDEDVFPLHIAPQRMVDGCPQPHQPFARMRAMSYPVQPGVGADLHFEGDLFEMEDQRNWTDASYKTYCTPLSLPFPVKVEKGTKIRQSITVSLHGEVPTASSQAPTDSSEVVISLENHPRTALPEIGLSTAAHRSPLSDEAIERLKCLNLRHLRVELPLGEPTYPQMLKKADRDARSLGVGLEIALFLTNEAGAELARLREELGRISPTVTRWLIFHGAEGAITKELAELARDILGNYDPNACIGAGTHLYFTQVNRSPPAVDTLDVVCYSINPQVHAFDDASLVETLEAQGTTVKSTRRLAPGLGVAVTPITLKPPQSPKAREAESELQAKALPPSVDPRQMSLFGAGWTLGSLKYLAEAGAASLTYYETTGWRGVMATQSGSPLPEQFPSLPGCVFPLYHVLADVGIFAGGEVTSTRSSDPLRVDAMVVSKDGRTRLLLANLSEQPQRIRLPRLGGEARLWLLDETNAESAMRASTAFRQRPGELLDDGTKGPTITLRPYAVARIDCEDVENIRELN